MLVEWEREKGAGGGGNRQREEGRQMGRERKWRNRHEEGPGREEGWWAWQREKGISSPVVSGCRPKRPVAAPTSTPQEHRSLPPSDRAGNPVSFL